MNENETNLITSLYQNCKTATQSIHDIIPKVNDMQLLQELKTEYDRYLDFIGKCLSFAHKNNKCLPDNNYYEKVKLWTSIKMTTIINKSTRHLTEMLILGTVMGVLQCYKDLHDYADANTEIVEMCQELLKIEEDNFSNLKSFLQKL